MISRSALSRGGQQALRLQPGAKLARRGFAAAASENASYEPTTIAGVKVASRDTHGPTTRLAVVAKGGTRYQPYSGLTIGMEEYAFKNTHKRSGLRIIRESELLGGQLTAYHTREALVLQASFLRPDLPYFAELLAEVITQTRYSTYEFHEIVEPIMHVKQSRLTAPEIALDAAHSVAFHRGLGAPLYPTTSAPIHVDENYIASFSNVVYSKPNIAVVADGASHDSLAQWVEPFFKSVPESSTESIGLLETASKYHGGEQRVARHGHKCSYVIAFPGYNLGSTSPEAAVLVALLGGESNVKWTSGFTLLGKIASEAGVQAKATNYAYSDAGLLTVQINGSNAAVAKAAEAAIKALKNLAGNAPSKEDLTKAIAKAKFDLLSASETSGVGIVSAGANLLSGSSPLQVAQTLKALESVTAEKVQLISKGLLQTKASVAAVGDLDVLPFAGDIGLQV